MATTRTMGGECRIPGPIGEPRARRRAPRALAVARGAAAAAVTAAAAATSGAANAQAPHPFAPPVSTATFSLTGAAAMLDANRDGASDAIVPGLFFGTMLTTLDEDGGPLAVNGQGAGATPLAGPMAPVVLALAGGRIDQDTREDLVTVTSCGTVHFHRNLGSTRVDRAAFATATLVDDFQLLFPISVPFVSYSMPVAMVADVDLDGHGDVVVAGAPIDRWTGSTRPGFVAVYRGDGAGGFQTIRYLLPGNPLDVEIADVDGDGTHDHLVVLTETGALGAFSYELVHLVLANGTLTATGLPFLLGPGRWTALELGDVCGDADPDYVLGQLLPSAGGVTSQLTCYAGDGQGHPDNATWSTLALPPNLTLLGDYVSAVQIGDWNRDSHLDLAVLRGFVQAPGSGTSAVASYAPSEVLVAMGPGLSWPTFETIALPGHHMYSATYNLAFALLPLVAEPDALRPIDLGGDGSIDFLVAGLRTPNAPAPTAMVTLRNLTPPQPGDARFEKVGAPSGGVAARPARIGFDGGRPEPGNASFACTIQNVQGGCLVGLLWGPVAYPGLQSVYGFDVHVAVAQFGCGMLASGSLPGLGFASFALPIPANPALVGDAGYFQWDYFDHVAGTFGGTQATGLWIAH